MAYEKTVWQNGDVITATKLNKMEDGIDSASIVFVVKCDESGVLDKTYQEIFDAASNGNVVIGLVVEKISVTDDDNGHEEVGITNLYLSDICAGRVVVFYPAKKAMVTFSASSPDEYPTLEEQLEF